jgi:formyltetrahydrofolate hydrolase
MRSCVLTITCREGIGIVRTVAGFLVERTPFSGTWHRVLLNGNRTVVF